MDILVFQQISKVFRTANTGIKMGKLQLEEKSSIESVSKPSLFSIEKFFRKENIQLKTRSFSIFS